MAGRRNVLVTEETSGLGMTKLLQDGEDGFVVFAKKISPKDKDPDQFQMVGQGLVDEVCSLDEAVAKYQGADTNWIFDRNCHAEVADQLRANGQRVIGTSALSAKMEYDRGFGVEVAKSCGLESPPTHEFQTIADGLSFLEANPDSAFVCKPNASENNYSTFVPIREDPEDANYDLCIYLRNLPEMDKGYILQERKFGVEANFEEWYYEGRPYLSFCVLENKRKMECDSGEMSGCAGDIVFMVKPDCKGITQTVGKMRDFYASKNYTGFADANVIIGDNQTWFLEVCNRFGYNSHPNLIMNLWMGTINELVDRILDGDVEDLAAGFRSGFGASITCFIEHRRGGLPLWVAPRWAEKFYPFDGYKPKDDVLLTGYGNEVGVLMNHDYTIEDAAERCLNGLLYNEAVSYPDIFYRHDLHKADYHGAPLKRYRALQAMGLI